MAAWGRAMAARRFACSRGGPGRRTAEGCNDGGVGQGHGGARLACSRGGPGKRTARGCCGGGMRADGAPSADLLGGCLGGSWVCGGARSARLEAPGGRGGFARRVEVWRWGCEGLAVAEPDLGHGGPAASSRRLDGGGGSGGAGGGWWVPPFEHAHVRLLKQGRRQACWCMTRLGQTRSNTDVRSLRAAVRPR